MKTHLQKLFIALTLLSTLNHHLSTLHAQGTAFTYQGRLNDGANSANGHHDLQFILFNVNQFGFRILPRPRFSPIDAKKNSQQETPKTET